MLDTFYEHFYYSNSIIIFFVKYKIFLIKYKILIVIQLQLSHCLTTLQLFCEIKVAETCIF